MRGGSVLLAIFLGACDIVFDLEGELDVDASMQDAMLDSLAEDARPTDCDELMSLFDVTTDSAPGSRYFFMPSGLATADYVQQCNAVIPGKTHLFAPASDANVSDIIGELYGAGTGTRIMLVGVVQDPLADVPNAAWFTLIGTPVPPTWWEASQPDDANGVEDTTEQLAGLLSTLDGMVDDDNQRFEGAICECDSRAVNTVFADLLDAYD